MPQLVEFEGSVHQFPDDFTQAEIQRALSSRPRSSQPPIPPLPPGYKLDPPAAIPPLPSGYKLDQPTRDPAVHDPRAALPDEKPPFDPSQPFQVIDAKPPFDPTQPYQVVATPPAANARPNPFDQFDAVPAAQPAVATAPLGAANAARDGRLYITPEAPKPIERPVSVLPSSVGGAARDFAVGAQGVGKGLTDIVTGPFDLVAGAQNLLVSGINKALGTNIPMATPASKLVEKAVDASGMPLIDPATMSKSEKLFYDVDRFGTQALGTGAMLAQHAPSVAAAATRSDTATGRVLDHMARPYTEAPARTLVGDTIGGMGAGVAVNAADNYVPEHAVVGDTIPKQVANILAPLVGGSAANTLQAGAEGLGNLVRNLATRTFTPPRDIPLNPATKAPYSNADVDRAAARLQSATTGSAPVDPRKCCDTSARPARFAGDDGRRGRTAGSLSIELRHVRTKPRRDNQPHPGELMGQQPRRHLGSIPRHPSRIR